MPILYIDKPKGITSFGVCNKLKKVLGTSKIGHTGTLDPNATGLMIVLYDEATKANQFLLSDTKEYYGVCKLGILTDTLDIDGKILASKDLKMPSRSEIESVFSTFIGKYNQFPPMTSAIKVNGKKLYEYQREGKEVELKAREVEIFELELLDINEKEFSFRCLVSSGTYVRSLLKDILDKLDLIGTLIELRRTKITLADATSLDDALNGKIENHSLYEVLKERYYTYVVDDPKAIKDGKPQKLDIDTMEVLLVDKDSNCLAIYRKENDVYRSVRGLF
ncbi:MAG: tRNA pseudouridine(55) synthase TruB [Erysipelotrichaceae bacterium]|nr:tRNA pseudouridine(55) synthase TruB [Erysipelotrichaceae bacterium]